MLTLYRAEPVVQSQPVLWWKLINEVHEFNKVSHLGMGALWGLIHRGEYESARAELDGIKSRWVEWTTLKR